MYHVDVPDGQVAQTFIELSTLLLDLLTIEA